MHLGTIKYLLRGRVLEIWNILRWLYKLHDIEYQNPILVYQMGKVGSSSVVRTLNFLHLNVPVLHLHTLNPNEISRAIAKHRLTSLSPLPTHLIVSKILVKKLRNTTFPCKVITLTREPIDRAISFAFEDWQKKAPDAYHSNSSLNVDKMLKAVTKMLQNRNGHSDPSLWFDNELKKYLLVDVFAAPYDFKKGYQIIERPKLKVLTIRMEDLNRSLTDALAEFLNINSQKIEIEQSNVGEQKWYALSLKKVKQLYTLPKGIADHIFETRYVNHFYAGDKEKIQNKWIILYSPSHSRTS